MQKLKELRKERNLSLKETGELLGVAESTVSLYENSKREAPYSILHNAAKIFGVSIDYLIGESDNKGTNTILVPVLDSISICSGGYEFICSGDSESIELGDPDSHFFFKAHDDSMEPYISEGDIALVKKQDDVESGAIAAVVYENSPVTLKKVVKEGDIIILGKVIQTIRKW